MKLKKIFAVTLILILSINLALAFGVTAPYWDDHPLEISAGQSTVVQLELQNMVGDKDLTVQGSIVQGENIAQITDKDTKYSVPFGSKIKVNTKISIPKDAQIGDSYTVGLSFTTLADPAQGLGFGSSIDKFYPVKVIEKAPEQQKAPSSSKNWTLYLIIAILVVLLITILIIRKNRKNKGDKTALKYKKYKY